MNKSTICTLLVAAMSLIGAASAKTIIITETFDTGLGNFDTEANNRVGGNNYGWSDTNNAGGTAGELAGREKRSGVLYDYVCDATLGAPLTDSDTIVMRGKGWIRNDNANGISLIGYHAIGGGNGRLGILLEEPKDSTAGRFRMTLVAGSAESQEYSPVPDDTPFEFDLMYDPDTKVFSGTIYGQSVSLTGVGSFSVDAFGFFDLSPTEGEQYFDFALDDLQYSVITEPPAWDPSPAHGQTSIGLNAQLRWQGPPDLTDPTYDIYFGTEANAVSSATRQDGEVPGDIDHSGRVVERDLALLTEWWLRDPCGVQPNPDICGNDSFVNSRDFAVLANDWSALSAFKGSQTTTSFEPGSLQLATTYYWRIDSVKDDDVRTGNLWKFSTTRLVSLQYTVFAEAGKFAGWPANNGVWTWGDNEILVSFTVGSYAEQGGHNISGQQATVLGRSLDGGQTWAMEDPDNFVGDGGTVLPPPGGIDFTNPDFAWRTVSYTSEGRFFFSYDRGHTWRGPYTCGDLMNHPELKGLENTSRTDYIVNGPDDCLIGMSVRGCGRTDRAFFARTTDGGATFNFISWINPEQDCGTRGVMPSTVRISQTKLVTTLRRKYPGEWIDAFVSYDNGNTWTFLSKVADTYTWNGNPPALVRLRDGRLCCAYGNRADFRIEARFSEDEGATWSEKIILRDDYQPDSYNDPDLGYCRMVQRPDGKLVTIYYWQTQAQYLQQSGSIEATIWSDARP